MPLPLPIPFDTVKSIHAGSVVYPPGGKFGPRIQHDVQLVMLYTGEMNVTIDGRHVRVTPGNVLLLTPGREEMFHFSKTEQSWHRWIAVRLSPISPEAERALRDLPECLELSEEMNRLTDLLLLLNRSLSWDDAAVRSLGLSALHLYPTESAKTKLRVEKPPAVYSALSWIRDHYMEEISLRELASHAGLSPEHFLRLFKASMQTTPIQYVWRYRVDRAVELLTGTGLNVSEIALRCGFKTSHHLARLVKQTTGKTASEIREFSWSGLR